MAEGVMVLNEATFEAEVLKSSKPVLVDFWATWCGPCLRVAPIIEELAKENAGKIKVAKVDIDENSDLASQFGVSAVPTFIIFKNGEEVDRVMGALPKSQFQNVINKHAN